jgi:RsiW-degrading membrane proteinase PrsW (M82 family)
MTVWARCRCGKRIDAAEALAGQSVHCPLCGRMVTLPELEPVDLRNTAVPFQRTSAPPAEQPFVPFGQQAAAPAAGPAPSKPSMRDYLYWAFLPALAPLLFMLVYKDKEDIKKRLDRTLDKNPEVRRDVEEIMHSPTGTLDELLRALPGERLDEQAHLPRSSFRYLLYGLVATGCYFVIACMLFREGSPKHLLLVGLFTATAGLGIVLLIGDLMLFDMGAYAAVHPKADFGMAFIGFLLAAGLTEEVGKAVPVVWYIRRGKHVNWRTACVWGLASGVGFGIAEGLFYSANQYNGIARGEFYLIRFASCVTLHAVWTAAAAISLYRWRDWLQAEAPWNQLAAVVVMVLIVPIVLHGLYDALLQKEMYALALLAALVSFVWLGWQIESRREEEHQALAAAAAATATPATA